MIIAFEAPGPLVEKDDRGATFNPCNGRGNC
jgi:hypothetical protein